MTGSKEKTYYLVTYRDPKDGTVFTLKARAIRDSTLGLGFVAISDFIFDKDHLVVTPDQESLEKRLTDVRTLHISIYNILSVLEMGQGNRGIKFKRDRSNLLILPSGEKFTPTKP